VYLDGSHLFTVWGELWVGKGLDHINRFSPAISLCLSQVVNRKRKYNKCILMEAPCLQSGQNYGLGMAWITLTDLAPPLSC
jgi:hypothetical protein